MPRVHPAGGGPSMNGLNHSIATHNSRQSQGPKPPKDNHRRTVVNGLPMQPPLVREQDPSTPLRKGICMPNFPVIESDAEPGDIRALWNREEERTLKRPNGRTQAPLLTKLIDRTAPPEKTCEDKSHRSGEIHSANCSPRGSFSGGYNKAFHLKETPGTIKQKVWIPFQEDEDGVLSQVINACTYVEHIMRDAKRRETFLLHRDGAAQRIVNAMHTLSKHIQVTEGPGRFLLAAMLELSWESNIYPSNLRMPDVVQREQYPVMRSHFGDIYKGSYRGKAVCIEYHDASQTPLLYKAFAREALVWNQLSHANILPFYGIDCLGEKRNRIGLVSPWMKHGSIDKFLNVHPDANRHSLILDVAAGLKYLHNLNIVHGNLSPANILVNDDHRACITGFDLLCIAETEGLQPSETPLAGGATRFEAPELLDPDCESSRSMASDVYAFGMSCYQILTGNVPFFDIRNEFGVIMKVLHGEHPPRLTSTLYINRGLTDHMWSLMLNCWQREPKNRPNISQISRQLLPSHETSIIQWADLTPSEFLGPDYHTSPSMSVIEASGIIQAMTRKQ